MKITLSLMTKLMRRVGNNPFASAQTRARNLLRRLQEEGYEVRRMLPEENAEEAFDPLHASLEAPASAPLTKAQQARHLYDAGDYLTLVNIKKQSKKSWAALGFVGDDISNIRPADKD